MVVIALTLKVSESIKLIPDSPFVIIWFGSGLTKNIVNA